MKVILWPKGDPLFRRKLQKFLKANLFDNEIVKIIKKENLLIPEDYFISYLISATVA